MPDTHKSILSPDHENAIGALVVACTKLESVITELIAAIAELDLIYALVLINPQQFASKIDSLKAVIEITFRTHPNKASVLKKVNRAKDIGDARNTLVHALYSVDDEGILRSVRFSARGDLTRSWNPVSLEKIRSDAVEAGELAQSFAELRDRLLGPEDDNPRLTG